MYKFMFFLTVGAEKWYQVLVITLYNEKIHDAFDTKCIPVLIAFVTRRELLSEHISPTIGATPI